MMVSLVVPAIILVMIILVVVVVIALKGGVTNDNEGGNPEGGEEMIKSLYVYLVLFATLMMSIGGSVSAFMSVADLVAPTPYYESYEDFRRWQTSEKHDYEDIDQAIEKPSEAELQARYDSMVEVETQKAKKRAKNSLIKSFGWIIIPLGIFIFFQRNLVKIKAEN